MNLEEAKRILKVLLKKVNHDEADKDSYPAGMSDYDLRLMAHNKPVREVELSGNSSQEEEWYCLFLFDPEVDLQEGPNSLSLPPAWQIYVNEGEIEHQVWGDDEEAPSGQKCEVVLRGEIALMTLISFLKNTFIAPRGKRDRLFVNVLEFCAGEDG